MKQAIFILGPDTLGLNISFFIPVFYVNHRSICQLFSDGHSMIKVARWTRKKSPTKEIAAHCSLVFLNHRLGGAEI